MGVGSQFLLHTVTNHLWPAELQDAQMPGIIRSVVSRCRDSEIRLGCTLAFPRNHGCHNTRVHEMDIKTLHPRGYRNYPIVKKLSGLQELPVPQHPLAPCRLLAQAGLWLQRPVRVNRGDQTYSILILFKHKLSCLWGRMLNPCNTLCVFKPKDFCG